MDAVYVMTGTLYEQAMPSLSALPPEADVIGYSAGCPLLTHSCHSNSVGDAGFFEGRVAPRF